MDRKSWLVQRLEKPRNHSIFGADNPFAFGGGLRNGGLSPEAMDLLRPLLSFEYMGAAEFEFGAVPEALQRMAEADLRAFTMTVPLKTVPPHWSVSKKSDNPPDGNGTIYVLCPTAWSSEVVSRITAFAKNEGDTKESVRLASTLRPHDEFDGETVGWLEISNGFFFATDREMWEGVCRVFGVEARETAASVTL